MNNKQYGRLIKLLQRVGYLIAGGIVWVNGAKVITVWLLPKPAPGDWLFIGIVSTIFLGALSAIFIALFLYVRGDEAEE